MSHPSSRKIQYRIIFFRYVSEELWPWSTYPAFCNGYVYALSPEAALKLVLASKSTPLLPLDDIFVTGVLRDRLEQPKLGLKLINSFSFGDSFIEWLTQCPFLGVVYYILVQDLAYQRDYWPWGTFNELKCLIMEEWAGLYVCDAKQYRFCINKSYYRAWQISLDG